MKAPNFASIGKRTDSIDVRLSYWIIELFSEGLYQSPNKAIEELVANSFDAGAQRVLVLYSSNLQDQAATITIIDDGEGMDASGLKRLLPNRTDRHLSKRGATFSQVRTHLGEASHGADSNHPSTHDGGWH